MCNISVNIGNWIDCLINIGVNYDLKKNKGRYGSAENERMEATSLGA